MARALFVCMLLGVLMLPVVHLSAQGQSAVSIISVSTDAFPVIATTVRSSVPPGASASSFEVTLNGTSIPLSEIAEVRVPVVVSVVADLSDGMRPTMAPELTRLNVMQQRLSELIWRLQAQPNSMSLVLIGDTVLVAHQPTVDLGGVDNTVANGNSAAPFALVAREQSVSPSPSLIQDGLIRGLAQIDQTDPTTPAALVLFASGDTWQTADLLTIQPALEAARRVRPIMLLIVGFGGDSATTPLREASQQLGATYIHHDDIGSVSQKIELNTEYDALSNMGRYTRISAIADGIPAGTATLQVTVGDATAEQAIDLPAHAPEITPWITSTELQDVVRIGISPIFAQSPIKSVNYLLDGRSLSTFGQQQDDLSIILDTTTDAFQQLYHQNQSYELVVAATDSQGLESRSAPVVITVLKPSKPPIPWLPIGSSITVLVVIVAGVLWWRKTRSHIQLTPAKQDTTKPPGIPGQPLRPMDNDDPTRPQGRADEEKTRPQGNRGGSDPTPPQGGRESVVGVWRLEFLEGATGTSEPITPTRGTHYEIGRPRMNEYTGPTYIPVVNDNVSRGAHAILTLTGDGSKMLLKANKAMNPIYIGPNPDEKLAVGKEVSLEDGAIFWLSNTVKIRVIRER